MLLPPLKPKPPAARPQPPEPDWTRSADIRYLVGATGTGKTHQARRWIQLHHGPVVVWDWKREFRDIPLAASLGNFCRRVARDRALRYEPSYENVEAQFEIFCRAVLTAQIWRPRTELLLLVDELQNCTAPERAPPAWKRLLNEGRVYGLVIVGCTPRPAFVDKSFVGNATLVRAGRLGFHEDARELGRMFNVGPEQLQQLPDRDSYVWDAGRVTLYRAGKAEFVT